MSETTTELLDGLRDKLRQFVERHEKLKEEKRDLEEANAGLQNLLQDKEVEMTELAAKYETAKMARSMSGEGDDKHEAKIRINRMVREIDKCIAKLNK